MNSLARLKNNISSTQAVTKSFNTTAYYLEHDGIVEGFSLTLKTVLESMLQGSIISRIDTYMMRHYGLSQMNSPKEAHHCDA